MTDERKPSFALFKNANRKTDKSPEYNLKAKCPHCGCDIQGPGWRKTSGKGLDYIGGLVEIAGEGRYEKKPEPKVESFNDEIPF
jgi:hypothetical protein